MIAMPPAASCLDAPGDPVEFGRVEAGGEFVEQEQPRTGRERAREVEHLLLRAVEIGGRPVGDLLEPVVLEQFIHRWRRDGGAPIGQRHLDVLTHGQRQKRLWHLEGAVDALMNQPMRGDPADRRAIEHNLAAIGRVKARDNVDRSGLARAVRTDEAQNFA